MSLNNEYLLKNGMVYLDDKFVKTDLYLADGFIKDIGANLAYDVEVVDCTNKIITPTFIDVHVHFRTPGFSYKEDLHSGSLAAIYGGYSHVFEMPNTKPCLDNVNDIKSHLEQINEEALCYVKPFSAASLNLAGKELVDVKQIANLDIAGFSDDGKGIQDDDLMKEILIEAGYHQKVVSAHCEDEQEFTNGMGTINEGIISQAHQMIGINNKSEYAMIQRDINLIEEIHNQKDYQYHVCHVSTKESVSLIKEAKAKSYNISCEVTPHHLISDDSEVDVNDSNYKMNPPLRSKQDVEAMVAGLNEGTIEIIATDHAPHSEKEKASPIEQAPFGIIGLELAFSLLNTYLIKTNKVKLETIINCLTSNPARIFKIEHGIALNKEVRLNIINLDKKVRYTKNKLKSKANNTFYLNRELVGAIEMVFLKDKRYECNNKEEV